MLKWLKQLREIVANYKDDLGTLRNQVRMVDRRTNDAVELIKHHTTVNADVGPSPRYPHTIVVIGQYRNNDYVQIFQIDVDEFQHIVRILRDMRRTHKLGKIDVPIAFKGPFMRDLDGP